MKNLIYPFKVLPLSYEASSLEPIIDVTTIIIHHDVIYKKAVEQLNLIVKNNQSISVYSIEELLFNPNLIPINIRKEYLFYAGSIYNHELFFDSLLKSPKTIIHGNFKQAVLKKFGSTNIFFNTIIELALSINNYGYINVAADKYGNIHILGTKDNDTTIPFNLCPLLVLDIWEHSYFLKYKEQLTHYLKNIFSIINFDKIEERYNDCLKYIIQN